MRHTLPDDARVFPWATLETLVSGHEWGFLRWAGSIWPFWAALGFWAALTVSMTVSPPPHLKPGDATLVLLGLLAIVLALFGFVVVQAVWRLLHRTRAVYLFADGLVYRDTAGEWGGAKWDEVGEVWRAETVYHGVTTRSYVWLILADGTTLLLDRALPRYDALANETVDRAARGMLPRLLADYAAGRRLRFGPFEMDRDGVQWGDQSAAWAAVTGFRVGLGYLLIDGPPMNIWKGRGVELRKVPNVAALFALLNIPGWEHLKANLPPAPREAAR